MDKEVREVAEMGNQRHTRGGAVESVALLAAMGNGEGKICNRPWEKVAAARIGAGSRPDGRCLGVGVGG